MSKSQFALAVDQIQASLRPFLKRRGFSVRGRTFNRVTEDRLTQVINIQMGASDPPGTTYFPGLRENLHGLFTVNLGIYVPEVARHHGYGEARSWVQDYHCCVRARLGDASGEKKDTWWHARPDTAVIEDVRRRLEQGGLPFLERYSTRDRILAELSDLTKNTGGGGPPRIVMAVILAERGEMGRSRELLARQAQETLNPGHPDAVRRLAMKLGVGPLVDD